MPRSANSRRVCVHLGAHKTGTTYIQNILAKNKLILMRSGIRYVNLAKLRNIGFSHKILKNSADESIADLIQAREGDPHVLLISEENLSGTAVELYSTGILYPRINEAVSNIEYIFGGNVEYMICVRSYSDFLTSMYVEYIRHNPFVRFLDFIAKVDLDSISWLRVIRDIASNSRTGVKVWTYELFSKEPSQIFSTMVGNLDLEFPEQVDRRVSVSAAAMRAIEALHGILDEDDLRRVIAAFPNILPRNVAKDRYDPMPCDLREQLNERYREDIRSLENEREILFIG